MKFNRFSLIVLVCLFITVPLSAGERPSAVYSIGGAEVAVWTNEIEGEHGSFTKKTFKVQKKYKNAEGEWQTTQYFDLEDLLKLKVAIEKAIQEESIRVRKE